MIEAAANFDSAIGALAPSHVKHADLVTRLALAKARITRRALRHSLYLNPVRGSENG
jgi:hypothetical protein